MRSGGRAATLRRHPHRSACGGERAPCTTPPWIRSSGGRWPACGRGGASAGSAEPPPPSTPPPRRPREGPFLPACLATGSSLRWSWGLDRRTDRAGRLRVKKFTPPLDDEAACPYVRPASGRGFACVAPTIQQPDPFRRTRGPEVLPGREVALMATRIRPLADRLI